MEQTGGSKMGEVKPSETKPKKMVARNVAIALGIICIVLVVGLVGAFAYYASQISSLNSEVGNLTYIASLDKSTVWVNDTTVTQTASNYTSWSFSADYAGYVSVNVQSSTTNNTYVRVIYSAYSINYDNTITVGTSGTASFPVLFAPLAFMTPSIPPGTPPRSFPYSIGYTSIELRAGNTNTVGNATETVTITYYY
jgi:nitrate reductase NapE component